MPTPAERAIAILDAVVDGTSTPAQRQRAVAAFGDAETFIRVVRRAIHQRILRKETAAAVANLPPPADTGLGRE